MRETSKYDTEAQKRLDLTMALRVLQNAGRLVPHLSGENADAEVQSIIDALCDLSVHDGLTRLVNATFFHAVLAREIERNLRTGRTCGLMVIDIDHFKSINDTFGHSIGDIVLQSVAEQIRQGLRGMDTAGRIGGEEFAILLPECEPEDAIHAASRIHSMLNPFSLLINQTTLQLTASAGLVWTYPNMQISSIALVTMADREMYRAKRTGRARLCYTRAESIMVSHPERSALMVLQLEGNADGL
jgi:diguanylate cyclase (GGDEF)-like protein